MDSAFEHQQQEAFREFQVMAYRDRKILWHNICQQRRRLHRSRSDAAAHAQGTSSATAASAPAAPGPPAPDPAASSAPTAPVTQTTPAVPSAAAAPTTAAPVAAVAHVLAAAPAPALAPAPAPAPTSAPAVAPAAGTWVPALSRPRGEVTAGVKAELANTDQHLTSHEPIVLRTSFIVQSPRPTASPRTSGSIVQTASTSEAGVFRLEEEAAADSAQAAPPELEPAGSSPPPILSAPVMLVRPPQVGSVSHSMSIGGGAAHAAQAHAHAIFGTSVPISIPARQAVTSFEAEEGAHDLADVPLSSTQRIKGYL